MQQLTELQRKFLQSLEESGTGLPTSSNVMDRFFFADVIICLGGSTLSIGSTMNEAGDNIPLLHLTFGSAIDDRKESIKDWNETHDEDDPYEGEIMAVRWLNSDTLEFFLVDSEGFVLDDVNAGICCVHKAMGN